jgi:hypothetical protein
MAGSGCEILRSEPDRFINYLFADPKLRKQIVDKKSFGVALEKALMSDTSLANIVEDIRKINGSFEVCGELIFEKKEIQDLIDSNIKFKTKEFRERIKKQHPRWKRARVKKELERRINIFIGTQSSKIKQSKQITIQEATRPVKVTEYTRAGKEIKKYSKTAYRKLTKQERDLISNAVKRGKSPKDTAQRYFDAGFEFRTETSIKRHYYRIKDRLGL